MANKPLLPTALRAATDRQIVGRAEAPSPRSGAARAHCAGSHPSAAVSAGSERRLPLDGRMKEAPWPYNLPIWRASHQAASPDGQQIAQIDPAYEISMGNPTVGTLRLSCGLVVQQCNPSFIWSDDSRFLAVPQFFYRLGVFRRQRMLVIDMLRRQVFASPETAYYFQLTRFGGGELAVTKEPFKSAQKISWKIPAELGRFRPVRVKWATAVQPAVADGGASPRT